MSRLPARSEGQALIPHARPVYEAGEEAEPLAVAGPPECDMCLNGVVTALMLAAGSGSPRPLRVVYWHEASRSGPCAYCGGTGRRHPEVQADRIVP